MQTALLLLFTISLCRIYSASEPSDFKALYKRTLLTYLLTLSGDVQFPEKHVTREHMK